MVLCPSCGSALKYPEDGCEVCFRRELESQDAHLSQSEGSFFAEYQRRYLEWAGVVFDLLGYLPTPIEYEKMLDEIDNEEPRL